MGASTAIGWTDSTWNPTYGCSRVSPGCDNCYAMTLAHRFTGQPKSVFAGTATTEGPVDWTGRINIVARNMDLPLRWQDPRMIFVNSQSDLFHDDIPDDVIAEVWAVMSLAPRHTFQVLTKRHGRMRSLVGRAQFRLMVNAHRMRRGHPVLPDSRMDDGTYAWPLQNVWLGVSVEDQQRADLRLPALLGTPAVVRFVSAEPLLGPVELDGYFRYHGISGGLGVGWVIIGGESGPGARPMDVSWGRSLISQCGAARVPVFFKQYGSVAATQLGIPGKGDDPDHWPSPMPRLWPTPTPRTVL